MKGAPFARAKNGVQFYHRTKECALEHASRGICPQCGELVFLDQPRRKVNGDVYVHENCYKPQPSNNHGPCGKCGKPVMKDTPCARNVTKTEYFHRTPECSGRGVCPQCGDIVFIDQYRHPVGNGTYYHEWCFQLVAN